MKTRMARKTAEMGATLVPPMTFESNGRLVKGRKKTRASHDSRVAVS
jgi:hypothetical protein